MTEDRERMDHPADEALARWVDDGIGEGAARDPRVAEHLAGCAPCRARVASLDEVLAALRAEPPLAPEAELAARRAAVLAAIGPRPEVVTIRSRWWWVPVAAAAGLAALLLLRSGGEPTSPERLAEGPAVAETAPLPIAKAAEDAAVEAVEAEPVTEADTTAVVVASFDATTDALPGAALADNSLETEFAGLEAEDQAAILDELATFQLEM